MQTNSRHILLESAGDANATPRVVAALEELRHAEGAAVLEFQPGATYHFHAEGCHRGVFYPSNNTLGEKKVAFPLLGHRNLTIQGNGARFLFHDRIFPVILQETSGCTLKDFTLDFSFPRYGLAKLVAIDGEGFRLKSLQPECTFEANERGQLLFHAGHDCFNAAEWYFDLFDLTRHTHAWLASGESKLPVFDAPAPTVFADVSVTSAGEIDCRLHAGSAPYPGEVGDCIVISFDEKRENDMVFLDGCTDTTLEGITFARGAGMGVIGQCCRNTTVRRCSCRIPEERRQSEVMALTADVLHFVNCSGMLRIEQNHIEDSLDDALNVHGIYTVVRKVLSPMEVEVEYCHWQQATTAGVYRPGDEVVVSSGATLKELWRATIVETAMCEDHHRQRLVLAVPAGVAIAEGDVIENPDRMPEVELCDNVIRNCPNIRMSSSKRTVISGNTLALSSTNLYVCDLMRYWYESGRVHDLLICDNVFCDVSDAGRARGIVIEHRRGERPLYCHENIRIERNHFLMRDGVSISADHVDGLRLEGNEVTGAHPQPVKTTDCVSV